MATWEDVRRLALALPQATESTSYGHAAFKVRDKMFVWERPLRQSDVTALGDAAPDGEILGVRVENEAAKRSLLESEPEFAFTTPHFDGYPAVLVQLDKIGLEDLEDLIVESWLCRAPKRLGDAYVAEHHQG
jgi:hypothetical protein